MESKDQKSMPRYKCHKEVHAHKIQALQSTAKDGEESDGSAFIVPVEPGYDPIRVTAEYMRKHRPQIGGYYVLYQDGYHSFSPAAAFEEGYTRV